jgi:hypothetical protein
MRDASLQTTELHHFVQRWQNGDAAAADVLFRSIAERLVTSAAN